MHRFKSVLDMHTVRTGEPEALPGFLAKLRGDRYFAMDFWALVEASPRSGRMAISREKMFETVVRCVGGPELSATDPGAEETRRELDGMARREAPDIAMMRPEEVQVERSAADRTAYAGGQGEFATGLAANEEQVEASGEGSRAIDEALARLEISNRELKQHLGEIESKVGRMEPQGEGSGGRPVIKQGGDGPEERAAAPGFAAGVGAGGAAMGSVPATGAPVMQAAPVVDPAGNETQSADVGPPPVAPPVRTGRVPAVAAARAAAERGREKIAGQHWEARFSKVLAGVRSGVMPEEVGTGRTMALVAAALVLLALGSMVLLREFGEEPKSVTVMPASVNYVDGPAAQNQAARRAAVSPSSQGGREPVATQGSELSGSVMPATTLVGSSGSMPEDQAALAPGRPAAGTDVATASPRRKLNPEDEEEVVEVASGPAKPSAAGPPIVAAPVVVAGAGSGARAADVSGGGADVGGEVRRVTVSSGVMAANLIASEPPKYPKVAELAHIQGSVVLQAVISKVGDVESVRVIKGHYMLRGSAANAVRGWRYRPFLLNGKPVEVATIVTVNFQLK